jgi:multiple sugar transport system substrate-binding protein
LAHGQDLTLRLLLPNGSGANMAPIIEAFAQMTGIKVQSSETQVDEINTELFLGGLSKSQQYDIALPATFGLPDLVSAEAILPITEYANRYEPEGFRDDILYGIGDSFDGQIYGFQTDGDAYMTFFNKAMQQKPNNKMRYSESFGYELEVPKTWAELDQQMAFFNDPENDTWGGLLFRTPGYLAWEWWMRFHAKGIWPFSPEMKPQIASDQGVAALEDMIRATESLAPEASDLGLFENWERFSRGDVYCNIGWGGTQKYLNRPHSPMRGNLVYGQTPGGTFSNTSIAMPYFNWGWNFVVTNNSKLPEIAYLFSHFASSPVMSTLAVRQADGFFDPFRPEHYEDAEIQKAYTPEFLEVHRASLETAIPDLYLKGQAEYFRILGIWLSRALAKEIPPMHALERVTQRWQLVTNASGLRLQQERWQRLRSKYPAHVRAVLKDIS